MFAYSTIVGTENWLVGTRDIVVSRNVNDCCSLISGISSFCFLMIVCLPQINLFQRLEL